MTRSGGGGRRRDSRCRIFGGGRGAGGKRRGGGADRGGDGGESGRRDVCGTGWNGNQTFNVAAGDRTSRMKICINWLIVVCVVVILAAGWVIYFHNDAVAKPLAKVGGGWLEA